MNLNPLNSLFCKRFLIIFTTFISIDPTYSGEIVTKSNEEYNSEKMIKSTSENINKIQNEVLEIKSGQTQIIKTINDDSVKPLREVLLPILLSIFSGFVFWLVFQALPNLTRNKRLRSKIDSDFMQIRLNMLFMIELAYLHCENTVSLFHREIAKKKLDKTKLNLMLHNKAMSKDFCVGIFSENIVIGDSISKRANEIKTRIDSLSVFNEQLSPSEILLLDRIHHEINSRGLYEINDKYETTISGSRYYPKNPSLSHLDSFFCNIHQLMIEVELILCKSKTEDLSTLNLKYKYFIKNLKFKSAIKTTKKIAALYPESAVTTQWNTFECLYEINKEESFEFLKKILNEFGSLVGSRGYISNYLNDLRFRQYLEKYTQPKVLDELEEVLCRENRFRLYIQFKNAKLVQAIEDRV